MAQWLEHPTRRRVVGSKSLPLPFPLSKLKLPAATSVFRTCDVTSQFGAPFATRLGLEFPLSYWSSCENI